MNENIVSFSLLRFHIFTSILIVSVLMLGNTALGAINLDVTSPDGGEYWSGTKTVTWDADTDPADGWKITLYWNSGTDDFTLASHVTGTERSWDSFDTTSFSDRDDYYIEIASGTGSDTDVSGTFAVDNTDPVLDNVSILSDNANTSYAEAGNIIILMFSASETIGTPTVTIDSNIIDDVTNLVDDIWSAAWHVPEGDYEGKVEFTIDFSDNAANTGVPVTATTDDTYVAYDMAYGDSPPFCGDNTCDADEDCSSCASDCGICTSSSSSSNSHITILPPYCGDSVCQSDESAYDPRDDTGCEADCGIMKYCGDNICQAEEDCSFCESDCGACSEDSEIINNTGNIDAENTDSNKTISEPEKTSALAGEKTPQSLTGLITANVNDSKTLIAAILVFFSILILLNHFYISKKKQ